MDAVRLALIGSVLWVAGVIAVATGVLPVADALGIADRVWPILLFVVAITVVAELAATAGVFDVAADALARVARGRTLVLWMLVVVLAVAATSLLSLDTTAVLLTPVVITIARAHRLDVMPFAFTTVWLANTASLVLPVSNLTNLLAADRLNASPVQFATVLGLPALIAIVVTVLLLWLFHRRGLRGRYPAAPRPAIADRVQLTVAAAIVVVLLPLLVSGIPPWIPATAAAALLVILFLWRSPRVITVTLVPWQLVVFASGLFLAIAALEAAGSRALLEVIAGTGSDLPSLWQLAGVGMLGANAINNLPAYLALESVADAPARLAALLVGVNAGSLITPWASLATLLWHERLQALGVDVVWRRYVLLGLLAAPVIVALSVIPLAFA
ncbi:SLC13 family permease [Microbacterium rhizomatis]|uniref:Arsenic transporter n=1 Tax=Microbacterium rhizomatis TaxID=1631477 RepID=A0A5J5J204_9MICO|nr:SLC13 family permease [Microbacterium rhizomatis]KAA9110207.1 arsenic transporter [Microbacterium rhizomatis]